MRILNGLNKKKNNKGSTFEIVLVSICLIAILAILAITAALVNLNMKVVDKNSKKSFYTAEEAVDELYAGLGKLSMESLESAYTKQLENVTDGSDNRKCNEQLRKEFTELVLKELFPKYVWNGGAVETEIFKPNKDYASSEGGTFANRLTTNYIEDNRNIKVKSVGDTCIKKEASAVVAEGSGDLFNYSIEFKDCVLEYNDENGYLSTVKIDCRLAMPDVIVAFSDGIGNRLTTFDTYSIIGCNGVKVENTLNVNGTKVFAGKNNDVNASVSGLKLDTNAFLNVNKASGSDYGSSIVSNDDIYLEDSGKISVDQFSRLWCENLKADGQNNKININGLAYVEDDLTINSDNTNVVINGSYTGWSYNGVVNEKHEESSAMIINGKNSSLDMQGINSLLLGGRSYINFNKAGNGMYMTGESVSLKGNQEIYLIPDSFIEVEGSAYHSNPAPTGQKVTVNIPSNFYPKANGWLENDEYITVNNGSFTYYYLNVKNDKKTDYLQAVIDGKDSYLATLRSRLVADVTALKQQSFIQIATDSSKLYVNGGLLTVSQSTASTSVGLEANANMSFDEFTKTCLDVDTRFDLLCHILYEPDPNDVTMFTSYPSVVTIAGHTVDITGTKDKGVFENLINQSYLNHMTETGEGAAKITQPYKAVGKTANGAADSFKVYVTREENILVSQLDFYGNKGMKDGIIISTGNVTVDCDYNGVIIAAGVVTTTGNVTVTNTYAVKAQSSDSAIEQMLSLLTSDDKDAVRKFFKAFNDKDEYNEAEANPLDMSIEGVTYKELVGFDNWSKNNE